MEAAHGANGAQPAVPGAALRGARERQGADLLVRHRPCAAVTELGRGADILIHEATTPEPSPTHSSPRQAGEVAARAGAGRLVLVHFSPRWTMPEADALAEVRAGGFAGAAEIGRDGQALTVGGSDDGA